MARKFYNEDQYNELLTKIFKLETENSRLRQELNFHERLKSLEHFAEIAESADTEMFSILLDIKDALRNSTDWTSFKQRLYKNSEFFNREEK